MKKVFGFAIVVLVSIFTLSTLAANIQYNGVTANGAGCPEGSYSITWAPDMLSFSILFEQMQTQIPGQVGRESMTSHCGLLMSMTLPPGLQLSVERIDYRGFYALDPGAFWMINSRYFFDNGAAIYKRGGNIVSSTSMPGGLRNYKSGPLQDVFTWGASTESFATHVSPCGGNTNLAVATNQNISSSDQPAAGQATLDSADANLSVVYKLKVTNCQYKFKPFPVNAKAVNDQLSSESL